MQSRIISKLEGKGGRGMEEDEVRGSIHEQCSDCENQLPKMSLSMCPVLSRPLPSPPLPSPSDTVNSDVSLHYEGVDFITLQLRANCSAHTPALTGH